jgi:GDP-mannose pyrophosphatase NudK
MLKDLKITETKILSDNWYILKKVSYSYEKNGKILRESREAYDRGNGATILLYHPINKTFILTRQFRLPTFINGNKSGMLIETCAGLLDKNDPETCIRRETEEETGYQIGEVKKVFEAYMSPGSLTEILHFYIAPYSESMKKGKGGGLEEEGENIEVMELPYDKAYEMVRTGEIRDGKTIMLLQYFQLNE